MKRAFGLLAVALGLAFAPGCVPGPPTLPLTPPVTPRTLTEEEEKVCREFIRLKNAKDSAANELLGPAPMVSDEPVSPEEAQRLLTDCFLRGDYEITDLWSPNATAGSASPPVILVTKGDPKVMRLRIRTPTGVDVVDRSILNPDLMVEVRDGKIYGIRSEVHSDRNQRPMTKAEAARLREQLGLPPKP
jgi:hypothetical protein